MRKTHSLMGHPFNFKYEKGGFSGHIRFRRKQPNGECVPPPAHGGPRRAVPPLRGRRRQPPPTRPPRPSVLVIGVQRVVSPSHFCWRSCIFHYQPRWQRDRLDRRRCRFPCNLLLVQALITCSIAFRRAAFPPPPSPRAGAGSRRQRDRLDRRCG